MRIEKNITQEQLADGIYTAKSTIGMWENGRRTPDIATIKRIADYFDKNVNYFIEDNFTLDNSLHDKVTENKCPICGYDCIHFVKTMPILFSNEKSSGVALQFYCEDDHFFYLVIEDYKGNNYITYMDEDFRELVNADFVNDNRFSLKYEKLDQYGKDAVNAVLDIEYIRMQDKEREEPNRISLMMYEDAVSAGTGEYLNDGRCVEVTVDDTPITEKADFILRVSGDSMQPTFYDGDKVLVESNVELKYGDIGIFILNGQGYIKEYRADGLHSHNKKYGIIKVLDDDNFKFVGKVIGKI